MNQIGRQMTPVIHIVYQTKKKERQQKKEEDSDDLSEDETKEEEEDLPGPGSPHVMIGTLAIHHWVSNPGAASGQGYEEVMELKKAYE